MPEGAAETVRRRTVVMERMGRGMLILLSGEPKNFSNDVFYPFRQENNLYYLTGINQPGITLVLLPAGEAQREILFLPKRDPSKEIWTGRMLSAEDARRRSGIPHIRAADELEGFLDAVLGGAPDQAHPPGASADDRDTTDVWLLLGDGARSRALFDRERAFGDTLSARFAGIRLKDALPIFRDLRIVKSVYEQGLIRRAVGITCEAHRRVMTVVAPGMNESELDGLIHATYRRHGAQWGFPSIVGSGPNATTLHYEENARPMQDGELVLIDIGAEVDHYAADVTRTIPVSGRYRPEQREIYDIVLRAQEAAIGAVRPGASIRDVHNAAMAVLKAELKRIGLIADTSGTQYRLWFMHGTSHWLGMDVHDLGGRDTPFQPGMVLTVEPGVYVREDALDYLDRTPENEALIAAIRPAFERYKNIGVRLEDDVLVTEKGHELLSGAAPRTAGEIEAVMQNRK
jgi:Xaa-Pro aminopeptidase